jgi:hypothetical protein
MNAPAESFKIRAMAQGGTTLENLRRIVAEAPAETNLVLLRAQSDAVRFPPFCPNCDAPASAPLRIERAFRLYVPQPEDAPNQTRLSIDRFDIPFCGACLDRHRSTHTSPPPWTPLVRLLSEGEGLGGAVVIGIGVWFVLTGLGRMSLVPILMGCFPLLVGLWLLRGTWKRSRHMSVPKPTEVDAAVDFSPVLSLPFEPPWRAFQFRSARYAARFREANTAELWTPTGAEAQAASTARSRQSFKTNLVVGAIVVAILLWTLWQKAMGP